MTRPRTGGNVAPPFWDRVDQSGGPDACWPWTRGTSKASYGQLWDGEKVVYAHRVALASRIGPIPDGLRALHTCDNPPCCNPSHLYAGTQARNVRDAVERGRMRRPPRVAGEEHPAAILTWAIVFACRRRAAFGETGAALGREFGVHKDTMANAIAGRSWRG